MRLFLCAVLPLLACACTTTKAGKKPQAAKVRAAAEVATLGPAAVEGPIGMPTSASTFLYGCAGSAGAGPFNVAKLGVTISGEVLALGNTGNALIDDTAGSLDSHYHSPTGNTVRFGHFDWGADCTLRIVADRAMLAGSKEGTMRPECIGGGIVASSFACTLLKATPEINKPSPKAVASEIAAMPDPRAQEYACTQTSGAEGPLFTKDLRIAVGTETVALSRTENAMIEGLTGTIDHKYQSKNPRADTVRFRYFDIGDDCELTLLIDRAAAAGVAAATLRAACNTAEADVAAEYSCKKG